MSILRSRVGLVGVVMVCVVALGQLGPFAAAAHALPPVSWTKIYFSDENFTNVVGERSLYCDGSRFSEGNTSTAHSIYAVYESCSGGAPLGITWEECFVRWSSGEFSPTPC